MDRSERSTITAIEPQKRRPDRVSIFVDGEFALGVHAEVASGFHVGQPVEVAELQELAHAEERRRARDAALHLLEYRSRSRDELRTRLLRKGYEPDVVQETVEALVRAELINDEEFTRHWVESRTGSRPMGPNRLAAELRRKGVEREVIDRALTTIDSERELELALAAARKKLGQLEGEEPRTARRKLAGTLQRRGFSWDVCSRVLDLLLGDPEQAQDDVND